MKRIAKIIYSWFGQYPINNQITPYVHRDVVSAVKSNPKKTEELGVLVRGVVKTHKDALTKLANH